MSDNMNDDQKKNIADNHSASPNIISAADEQAAAEQEAQQETVDPAEKVEIDHAPIADEDIEFRSKDIQKKDTADLFVNVSDAEKIAKEKEHNRLQAEKQKAKEDKEKRRIVEREKAEKAKAEAEAKAAAAREEKRKTESAKAKLRKDEAERKHREREEAKTKRRTKRQKFFKKYRYVMLAAVAIIIVASGAIAWVFYYNDNRLAITGAEKEEDIGAIRVKMVQLYYGDDETDPDEISARTDISYEDSTSEQYKKTAEYLDNVISSTKDVNLKAEAVLLKASMLLDSKQLNEAKVVLDDIDENKLEKKQLSEYYSMRIRYAILTDNDEERVKLEDKLRELNGVEDGRHEN